MDSLEIKYIDNDVNLGIKYDLKEIRRVFKTLRIPSKVFNPLTLPLETLQYFCLLSERQLGKTTNILLLGMVFNKLYGTIVHYVRQTVEMIRPMRLQDLFSTICKFGYVDILTDGQFNTVIYDSKRWYYAKIDEKGEIIEKANEHFMFCCAVDEGYKLKSSYNCPVGDFIIFDEFISNSYAINEFVRFSDLVKTIINNRISPYIFLIANTIDRHSMYFEELEIEKEIQTYEVDRLYVKTTSLGTNLGVKIISSTAELKQIKNKVNQLFFGFKNPNLQAITGLNGAWSDNNYKHLQGDEFKNTETCLFFEVANELYKIDNFYSEKIESDILYVHHATKIHDDSIVLTLSELKNKQYKYAFGNDRCRKILYKMLNKDLVYYQSNSVGSAFAEFIKRCENAIK